jgi:hypothetical protein
MSKPLPNFVFHVPKCGNVINYDDLEQMMHTRQAPRQVEVVDSITHKRMGHMHPSIALMKFR